MMRSERVPTDGCRATPSAEQYLIPSPAVAQISETKLLLEPKKKKHNTSI